GRRGICARRRARGCGRSLCGYSARRLWRRRRIRCRSDHLFRSDEHYSVGLGARESLSIHTLLCRCFGCCCTPFESPLSGSSANPARTFGPAMFASYWHALWIYFTAPSFGMLAAAEDFLILGGGVGPFCAKLHHATHKRCIFRHGYRTVFTFFG